MLAYPTIQLLPNGDPYRRVLDGQYEPTMPAARYERIRPMLLDLLELDATLRPTTRSVRGSRRGRIAPYLAWCDSEGMPWRVSFLLDRDLVERYIETLPSAAGGRQSVEVLRSTLTPLAIALGHGTPPASKVRRFGDHRLPPVDLRQASFLLGVASSLRGLRRDDARVVLVLGHGAGLEARYIAEVTNADLRVDADDSCWLRRPGTAAWTSVAREYEAAFRGVLGRHGTVLRPGAHVVRDAVEALNAALARSGRDFQISVPALRAGRRAA